jgi:hypothetical protein
MYEARASGKGISGQAFPRQAKGGVGCQAGFCPGIKGIPKANISATKA